MRDIYTQTPEMPRACRPVYLEWASYFNRIVEDNEDLILIGHSCGAGFLLRWLSETRRSALRTVLVAPWLDPQKLRADPEFFKFDLDYTIKERTDLHIVASDNDMDDIVESVRIVRETFPEAGFHLFQRYGHFCLSDMETDNFPELLKIVVGDAPITNASMGARPASENENLKA